MEPNLKESTDFLGLGGGRGILSKIAVPRSIQYATVSFFGTPESAHRAGPGSHQAHLATTAEVALASVDIDRKMRTFSTRVCLLNLSIVVNV